MRPLRPGGRPVGPIIGSADPGGTPRRSFGGHGCPVGTAVQIEEALLDDGRLDAVSFTGSTPVGRSLQRRLAGRNVRLQTELGGKNASAVLADADLNLAVRTIASAAFGAFGAFTAESGLTSHQERLKLQLVEMTARYFWGNEL